MFINLLIETRQVLEEYGKSFDDVIWIGNKCGYVTISKSDFLKYADVMYDNGYGLTNVNTDLIIVGDNWWLEREEYDGSEWWEFKTMPILVQEHVSMKNRLAERFII